MDQPFRAAAPGSTMVCVSRHNWLVDGWYAVYVPLPKDVPPGPLEGLFATGEPKPPASQPVVNGRGVQIVRTYPGNIVGYWGGATDEPPPRPFDRPDFAAMDAAATAAAAAAIRIAIAPDRRIRDRLDENRSMLELPFHLADWLAVTCDPGPGGTIDLALEGDSEAGAQRFYDAWVALVKRTFDPAEPRDAAKEAAAARKLVPLLTPTLRDDRMTLSFDAAALPGMILDAKPALRQAQRVRLRDLSADHMRRLLAALHQCVLARGEWPDDLAAAREYLEPGEYATIVNNSAEERQRPGYAYVRPDVAIPPGGTVVLYEKHETFGDWRLVGFADGRVEVVYDEARFKRLLGQD